jgi:hypothetical protein
VYGRRTLLLAGAVAAVLVAPSTAAAQGSPEALGAAVARDVVHVAPGARSRLNEAQAGRLRLRIVDRAIGRIKVVVVPGGTARAAGGTARLAKEVAEASGARGATIVVAGGSAALEATYPKSAARAAVRRAMAGSGSLTRRLRAAIDGVARVDPGPQGDEQSEAAAEQPPPSLGAGADDPFGDTIDDVGDTVEGIGDAVRIVIFVIGAVVVLVIAVPLLLMARRVRRERADLAEDFDDECSAARDELVAVGDLVRELDITAQMPGADPGGLEALGRAVDLYGRAERQLGKADNPRRLHRARVTLGEAREQGELARTRLGH